MSRIPNRNAVIAAVLAAVLATVVTACVMPPPPAPTTTTTTTTSTSTTTTTSTSTTTTTTVPSCPTYPTPAPVSPIPPGAVVLAENPVTGVALGCEKPVVVTWTGQAPGQLIYVDICRKPTADPTFQPGEDCAPLSSFNPNGTPTGSGSAVVSIFRGPEPSTDLPWGCFRATDVAPAGVQRNTTCYVRVTNNSLFNNAEAREACRG